MTTHLLFDGRVQVYTRAEGAVWQCAARLEGQRFRHSTGQENLDRAIAFAEEWYLDLRAKVRNDVPVGAPNKPKPPERIFADAAAEFLAETKVLAATSRSPLYAKDIEMRLNSSLLPYFGKMEPKSINRSTVQSYVVKRTDDMMERRGRAPARSTILSDLVVIRQVLKFEEGAKRIPYVPSLSLPYLTLKKKGRRAWFSPAEYEQLYKATRRRCDDPKRRGWKSEYEDLHDYVLLMANSGLRPDEAAGLEIRDVAIEEDYETRETILVLDVRGKTGVGFCKTTANAVQPFRRLVARRRAELEASGLDSDGVDLILPRTKLFRKFRRDLFNTVLREEGLKQDRDGKKRTAYSLRHTYISMRLMEGAEIYPIAINCRTSVQMIEEHYAAHIKDRVAASAVNVQRSKRARKATRRRDDARQQPPA